jgi:hypothetical protein
MNKSIFFILLGIMLMASVTAATTVTRTIPDRAEVGTTFQVIYNVSSDSQVQVAFDEEVEGACFTSQVSPFSLITENNVASKTVTYTAPSSAGNCRFMGSWAVIGQSGTNIFQNKDVEVYVYTAPVTAPQNIQYSTQGSGTENQNTTTQTSTGICSIAEKAAFFELVKGDKCKSGTYIILIGLGILVFLLRK